MRNPISSHIFARMQVPVRFIKMGLSILVVCLGGGAVITFFSCNACRTSPHIFTIVTAFSSSVWFLLWMGNWAIGEYIETRIRWVDYPWRRLIVSIATTLIYSIAVVVILLIIFESAFNFNFGNYFTVLVIAIAITFVISLVLYSETFLKHWKEAAIRAERFEKESIRAQYESLKNQVNPHFLFNSLNALTNLVYEDQERATKFIKQLSDVYRYVLDTREKEIVPLEEELRFLRSYIYLQEIRFEKNLVINIDLAEETETGYIAPLAMQLLVENAIKHNIVSRDEPLNIDVYQKHGFYVVENDLQKKVTYDENLSGLGLENIKKRYSFLTNEKVSIEEGGGKFTVRLPILNWSGA